MAKSTAAADTFDPTSVEKEVKGKMILIYATVNGVREHVASLFHESKADWILEAIEGYHDVQIKKPKKTTAPAKKGVKKAPVKKKVKR